jgi:hypothetical protein
MPWGAGQSVNGIGSKRGDQNMVLGGVAPKQSRASLSLDCPVSIATPAAAICRRAHSRRQRLLEVGDQILLVLDPD